MLTLKQIEQLQAKALAGQLTPEDSQRLIKQSIYSRINRLQHNKEARRHGQKPLITK